jgi:hypothetical protein
LASAQDQPTEPQPEKGGQEDLLVRVPFTTLGSYQLTHRQTSASACALTISAVNMAVLTILHGQELGFICLASCSTDVLVNALVLFWLTQPGYAKDERSSAGIADATEAQANRSDIHNKSHVSFQMRRVTMQPGIESGTLGRSSGATRPISGHAPSTDKPMMSPILLKGHNYGHHNNALSPPPSPSNLNFKGYTSVYDGTQNYFRNNPDQTMYNGNDDKGQSENASSVYMPHDIESGNVNDRVHVRNIRPTSSLGFFDRILGRKNSTTGNERVHSRSMTEGFGRGHRSQGSLPAAISTFGGIGRGSKKKRDSDQEDAGVRVTITTRMDVEEYIDIVGEPVSAKGAEESRGSESTKGGQ